MSDIDTQPIKPYSPIMKVLHWVVGFAIIGLLIVGIVMEDMDKGPAKWELYGLHKSVGMIVLALVIFRFIWKLKTKPDVGLPSHENWERKVAKSTHHLLYLLMFIMPLSGWMMSSFGGHKVVIFGLLDVTLPVAKNETIGGIAHTIHGIAANIMIAVIVLHIAGALKHQFVDKDATLKRMLPFAKIK